MDVIIGTVISVVNLLISPCKALWVWIRKIREGSTVGLRKITAGFDTRVEVADGRVVCSGWAKGMGKHEHLWLAVVVDDLFWPKEGQIKVIDGKWNKKL